MRQRDLWPAQALPNPDLQDSGILRPRPLRLETTLCVGQARALAEQNGFTDDETLISFCNTEQWAATNWFALSELAGVDNVRLYPESMVDWSNVSLPMANMPRLLQNLWKPVTDQI